MPCGDQWGSGGKDSVHLLANCFQAVYSNVVVTTNVRDNNSIDRELEDSAQRTLGKGIEITREEIHS
jgi:PP-loop superfamily ATP-utilizing enzyme